MIVVPALEWNVARGCNLSCEGCLTFSDFPYTEILDKETLRGWYKKWNQRIAPKSLAVLGGEPLLNKEILSIIEMTREMWSKEHNEYFELVTNGFLLKKYQDLPKVLRDTNCVLAISVHHQGEKYRKKIEEISNLASDWEERYNIKVKYYVDNENASTAWKKTYSGLGTDIRPFNDYDPQSSWNNCITGQKCWQLFRGCIYKCPLVAYLPEHKEKFGLHSDWDQYLDTYSPLTPEATDQEIIDFFARGAESCCGMCPANEQSWFEKPDPIKRKKEFKVKFDETNRVPKRKK